MGGNNPHRNTPKFFRNLVVLLFVIREKHDKQRKIFTFDA